MRGVSSATRLRAGRTSGVVSVHRLRSPTVPALDFGAIRTEIGVPGAFPADVLAEADRAAAAPHLAGHVDATDLDLVTIDPPGSMDLDQAMGLADRSGGGWTVHYAIADVAAWVEPGGALDLATRARTQTFYAPDHRTPLHPPVLGEQAASLLPDGPRPAVLWTIEVDPDGTTGRVDVRRALVRSQARLDYAGVQTDLDAGRAPACVAPLAVLGPILVEASIARGAIELGLPEQEVVADPDGTWTVELRADLPVEQWNAQISLLTGRAAAALMVSAGVGILRTLPPPDPAGFPRLQDAARRLGVDWPEGASPGQVLAGLDMSRPRHAAFADLAAGLLRGAGYTALPLGDADAPLGHAGVGDRYAHVTAPLRRLVDRFGTEICLAVAAGQEPPAWALEALPTLPEVMTTGDALARRLERASIDATEAFVLHGRVGEVFPAAVIESGQAHGTVTLDTPAVRGRCDTRNLPLGADIHVRCTQADVEERQVRFERVS